MDPFQDFDSWLAIAEAVSLDVTQFSTFVDGFDLLLGLINQNGFLPDKLQGQTNYLIHLIKTKFVDHVLSYGNLGQYYILPVYNLLFIFLKFSLYGVSIGDNDIISIGSKIIESENSNVFLQNQNIYINLMKQFAKICQEEQILETAFDTRIDTITAFSQVCPFIRVLFKYCDHVDYCKFLQNSTKRLQAIIDYFGNYTSANQIQIIIKTFIETMPFQETEEMVDLFIQTFLPIVISFILQVNEKIEQSYYAFSSLQEILNSFKLGKKAMNFIIQSSDFQALKDIQFSEKLSEGLKVFYTKLAQFDYLDEQSIINFWNQHSTIYVSEFPIFLDTIMNIISKARNGTLDAIIEAIIKEKDSLSNWRTIIANISSTLKHRTDTQEQQYKLRDCIWEDCFTPNENQKEFQKAFLSIISAAGDANTFESISDKVLSGELDNDTLKFCISALNIMLNNVSLELDQELVNNLITFTLNHLFTNKDEQYSTEFLPFIPLICSKQNTLISENQLMMVASHRNDFDGFFALITELYQKGVIDPSCFDTLIDKLGEQPDQGFFNFFKIVCQKENRISQPYKNFPLVFEDKLWKYCLTEGVARQSFNELLCTLYSNNDTKYVQDDAMIYHFFYNFDEFRTGIKKNTNEEQNNLEEQKENDPSNEDKEEKPEKNEEDSKIIVKHHIQPENAPISPFLTELLITFVSFIEDEQDFTHYALKNSLFYINPDKMKTEIKVYVTNVITRDTKCFDFSRCATVGTLIIKYSDTYNIDPGYIQVNRSGTVIPLERRVLLERLRDTNSTIKVDVLNSKIPVNFHKRTTLPITVIADKKYENLYLKDMINFNSESSYRFLSITTVNPVLWQAYTKLEQQPTEETIDNYFNFDKIYYMCYNMDLFYFYLNTEQSLTFAEKLSESNFFFHVAQTIYNYLLDKTKNNEPINPIINDMILSYTKSLKKYPVPFKENEINSIFKICLQIASVEKLYFQSRLNLLDTMSSTNPCCIFRKAQIPFPDDFYETFISLIMNESLRLRKQAEMTMQCVVFPPSVFYETLLARKEQCSNEFLNLMQTHINNFKPFAEEMVSLLLQCCSQTTSYSRKCFIQVLNVCLQKEQVSESLLLKIQHFFIDAYLKFDLTPEETLSFNPAINILLQVANINTPIKSKDSGDIVYENKLYNKLLSFHTDREPLGEFDIDGDKCLQRNGRSGLKKYGQTCYLNSTLQMLFTLPRIRKMLINQDCGNTMLSKLHELFTIMKYTNKKSISTKNFVDNCVMFENDYFSPNEQQDAAEFLGTVLDKLCSFDEYKETIKALAQCQIENVTEGISTEYKSTNSDDVFLLPLELSKNLETSFYNLIQPNYLTKQNQYYAQHLGTKIDAKRFSRIKHCPPNLFITLNRFKYNLQKRMREKISTECAIPLELDISKYVTTDSNIQQNPYKLKAAIIHKGSAAAGHYICYVKKPDQYSSWLKCDESEVTCESEEQFLKAANGKEPDAAGYIFVYSQDLDDLELQNSEIDENQETTPIDTINYHPDSQLLEIIEQENEKNHKSSLFCSTGYKNLIINLSAATHSQFHDICLRYCCDTAPYLNRNIFSDKKIYQILSVSLSNSKELSEMFFNYSQPFIRDIFIQSRSLTVQRESANLFKSVCLSKAISTNDALLLLLLLIPDLFERYDSTEPVFRVIRKIAFLNDSVGLLNEENNKNLLFSFITDQFVKYLNDHPMIKRNYVLDGLNLSSYLKLISSLDYPKEQYEVLYDHRFFVDMISTKSKPRSLSLFILKYFDVQTYVNYFIKRSASLKCRSSASILYFLIPNEATQLLLFSAFNKEDVANEIIRNAKQRKKHNITQYLISNAELWITEYLLNSSQNYRFKGVQIASAVCPSKPLTKFLEEEDDYEEDQINSEEEEESDDEGKSEKIQDDCVKLLKKLLDCVLTAEKLLESVYIMSQRRNEEELLDSYIQVIFKLLLTVANPEVLNEQQTKQNENDEDNSEIQTDAFRAVSNTYNLEKLEILCKPIGQFCSPFSLQGSILLNIFYLYHVPITDDVIFSFVSSDKILSQQDSSKFSKYLFFIYGILIARPEKHWSPLIQYIIEQVLFNNPTFFKDNSTLITEITKLFRKYYIDSLQNAINTDFLRCAGNNFPLALNVCYQTQTKMPFLSHIRYSLILNPIKFSLDLIEKLASVNSDQTIDKEEYESLKNPINKNFFTEEAFEYLINYIDSQVTIQEHANPISLEQNDNEKDNENKGNDDENQEENTKIDENQNENENADDEEDEKANEEEEIKENNENNQSDKNQEEELAPPELIEENEDKTEQENNDNDKQANEDESKESLETISEQQTNEINSNNLESNVEEKENDN